MYFESFYQTGFYYNFVGIVQLIAGILLLIPRTSTIGAVVYFPIILNICLITHSLNFKGTWVITSLMLLANIYLLCWDYDKFKPLLSFSKTENKRTSWFDFLFEGLIWAFSAMFFYFLIKLRGIPSLYSLSFAGAIVIFAIGLIFGMFIVWRRRKQIAV